MCLAPFCKKDGDIIPCGKCPDCRKRYISGWSFRLMQQEKLHSSSYFITLTYDTNSVPISRNGFMSLCKRHVQLFLKRVRKSHPADRDEKIKYYAVGEYGGKGSRPHYHIILFGAQLELMLTPSALLALKVIGLDGKHPVQCKQWDHGHITVGLVSGASIGYTMKYVCKPRRIPLHRNDDRIPEFPLSSKGLGSNYITDAMFQWHHDDLLNRKYLVLPDGKKIAMPRYYRDKIYDMKNRADLNRHFSALMLELYSEVVQEYNDPVKHRKAVRSSAKAAYDKMYADLDRGRQAF